MPSTLPRPLKTLTKGLDFSSLAYKNDKNYSSQDFIGQVSKVLEFLKNNLPVGYVAASNSVAQIGCAIVTHTH